MTAPEKVTGVELTEAAQQKASALLAQEGRDDLSLRIAVQPGGCAGLRYPVSYTHLTLPTILRSCRSRWSPYH